LRHPPIGVKEDRFKTTQYRYHSGLIV